MISDRLKRVILSELELEEFELNDATRAHEVPGWDSLRHVGMLTAVEDEFGIRFSRLEVVRLKNLGELQELINKKVR